MNTSDSLFSLSDFKVGDRLRVHPATDLWMRGIRFVTVLEVGRYMLSVQADGFNRTTSFRLAPRSVLEVLERG